PQSGGDGRVGPRGRGLGGQDRLLHLETVAQSGVEDVDGVRPDHGTPSHMFPKNGTLLASSRLCEGSLPLYSALISDNRLCSSCESAGRIGCSVSRLLGRKCVRMRTRPTAASSLSHLHSFTQTITQKSMG